ncbi:hypothetical protein AHAS_Ahas11G0127400 [Arachis hypogaea]
MVSIESQSCGSKSLENVNDPHASSLLKDGEGSGVRIIQASVAENNWDWLKRSIVGSTMQAIDFRLLSTVAQTEWPKVVKVCALGAYKALLVFDSTNSADEALTIHMTDLLKFFHRVGRWSEHDRCDKRRVWIECIGVPLHTWSEATFRAIGEQWGEVVVCEHATMSCLSFSTGRVLIDTPRFDVIHEKICMYVGKTRFDVFVSEVRSGTCDPLSGAEGGAVARNQGLSLGKGSAGMGSTRVVAANCHGRLGTGDISAKVILPTVREEEQVKGKVVISSEDLNEWNNEFLNSKTIMPTIKGFDLNLSQEDIGGSRTNDGETDLDRTVSWDFSGGRTCAGAEATSSAKRFCSCPTEVGVQNFLSKDMGLPLGFKYTGPQIGSEGKHGLICAACFLDRVPHMIRTETCAEGDLEHVFDEMHEGGADVFGGGRTQSFCAAPLSEEGDAPDGEVVRRGLGRQEASAEPGSLSVNHDMAGEPRSLAMEAVILEGRPNLRIGKNRRSGGDRELVLAGIDREGGKTGYDVTGDLGLRFCSPMEVVWDW